MKDRQDAITRGDKVKGGKNFVLNARLLGLRVSNLRDDRIEKKANKLDSVSTCFPRGLSFECRGTLIECAWRDDDSSCNVARARTEKAKRKKRT